MKRVLFILGHLSDLDVEWLMENGCTMNLEVGDRLITRNKHVDSLYIILSGKLSVIGNNQMHIATIDQGEMVGEMSFLESHPPSVSVIATEETNVFCISKELVDQRLNSNVEFRGNFYYAISLFLSNRLRKTTGQLGYGNPEEEDMIDENVLDGVSQAGSRFTQIMQKFSAV